MTINTLVEKEPAYESAQPDYNPTKPQLNYLKQSIDRLKKARLAYINVYSLLQTEARYF